MIRFTKEQMIDGETRMRAFLKKNNRYPNWLNMKAMDGKTYELIPKQIAGLYEAENVFRNKNNRRPNYVTLNTDANNPLVLTYQPNNYTCCPTSVAMASQMLFNYKTVTECSNALGTTKNGTTPANLINNIGKLGMKAVNIGRTYENVKKSIDSCKPVVAHIETGGRTRPSCLSYINNYGHYILIYGITDKGYYKVADPTKGLKTCQPTVLNNATNGRTIGFYSISLS